MDSYELQQPHPRPHHLPSENVVLEGPNPFTNIVPTTMMITVPQLNMNTNQPPHSEPFNNNIVPSTLNLCVGASSGSGSIQKKRGRPRKYFLDGYIALIAKTSTSGRGRPRGSLNKKKKVEVAGMLKKFLFHYLKGLNMIFVPVIWATFDFRPCKKKSLNYIPAKKILFEKCPRLHIPVDLACCMPRGSC